MTFRVPDIDTVRAGLMAVINALFPMLQIFGIIDWSAEQLATVMAVITTLVTLFFYFFRPTVSQEDVVEDNVIVPNHVAIK